LHSGLTTVAATATQSHLEPLLQQTATAEALQAICDLDLVDLQAIEPPRGFGRD